MKVSIKLVVVFCIFMLTMYNITAFLIGKYSGVVWKKLDDAWEDLTKPKDDDKVVTEDSGEIISDKGDRSAEEVGNRAEGNHKSMQGREGAHNSGPENNETGDSLEPTGYGTIANENPLLSSRKQHLLKHNLRDMKWSQGKSDV